jgi:hypothetical protein
MRGLDAGSIKEMEAKYGSIQQAEGFDHDEKLHPSVLFKPKLQQTCQSNFGT